MVRDSSEGLACDYYLYVTNARRTSDPYKIEMRNTACDDTHLIKPAHHSVAGEIRDSPRHVASQSLRNSRRTNGCDEHRFRSHKRNEEQHRFLRSHFHVLLTATSAGSALIGDSSPHASLLTCAEMKTDLHAVFDR